VNLNKEINQEINGRNIQEEIGRSNNNNQFIYKREKLRTSHKRKEDVVKQYSTHSTDEEIVIPRKVKWYM
jgi:hypothetical protein